MKKNKQKVGNKFFLEGLNIERFLNALTEQKISVYNLNRVDINKIEFEVRLKDAFKVEKLISNFHFEVKREAKGVLGLLKFFQNRIGIVIGLILALALVIVSNQFTFNFSILGLENIEEAKIEEVLKNNGIEKFKINNFDAGKLEEILSAEIPEISMVSVMKKGTTIIINIKEKLPTFEEKYKPIVAEYNMLIESLEVYAGFTNLKVGDSVLKGDTIVYPYEFDGNGNPTSCEPKAKIKALTWFSASKSVEKVETRLARTGRKQFLEVSYKLGNNEIFKEEKEITFENFEVEEVNRQISYMFLPINITKKVAYEIREEKIEHNFELEKGGIIKNCLETAYGKVPSNILIDDEKVVLSNDEDRVIVSVYLQASISIGED